MNLKKLLSLLLSVVMVVTLVPMAALAESVERTVVYFTTIGSFTKRQAVYTDVTAPAMAELKTSEGDGYYFAKKSDGAFFCQSNIDTFKIDDGSGGYYVPIYLYKVEGGVVSSMEGEEAVVSGSMKEYWDTEKVTVDGKVMWKIIPVVSKYNKANSLSGSLEVWDASTATVISRTYTLSTGPSVEYSMGDYGFTFDDNSSDGLSSFTKSIDVANDVGKDMIPQTYYLAKSVNGNVSYVLEDEIDVSTLTVSTTDGNLLDVTFVTETPDTKENVLGITFNTTSNTAERMEELKISFKTLNASDEYYIYGGVECRPATVTPSSVTVDNTGDFLYYYSKVANGSTIYLKSGTYSFDFVHNRNVNVLPAEGAQVIFNGTADTSKPVVTIAAGMAGRLGNFIIDGRNKTKTGITAIDGYMLVDTDRTIRNCNIAVEYTTGGMFQLSNAVIENNKTGVVVGNFSVAQIKNNNFVGNTTDVQVNTAKTISITQNYFGGSTPKISTNVETPTVYYSPFYIDEAKTILTADIAGAEPVTTAARTVEQKLTLPVDLTVNGATKFDNRLFDDMKKPDNGAVAVEIPVTEGLETGDKKVTTIWGFDNGEGNIAATLPVNGMDLKVTSVPSSNAQTIVTNTVENTSDIVQYVNFKHNGTLPGKATVKVLASTVSDASELKLYYINETTGKVETAEICDVELVEIDGEKYYVITVDHCSEYIITTSVVEKSTASEGGQGGSTSQPSTGTTTPTATPAPVTSAAPAATTAPTASSSATTKPSTSSTVNTGESTVNDFVSAVEIEEKLEETDSAEVIVDVTDKNDVSPKAFELLAEYPEKTLVFEGENYSLSFAAADLTDPDALGDTTFNAAVSLESPNKAAIEAAAAKAAEILGTEKAELIHVYFSHHGTLPGKATVKIFAGKDHAGLEKHVHYFDAQENAFDYISTVAVDSDGWVEFTIEHCSDYVLSDVLLDTSAQTEGEDQTATEKDPADTTVTEPAQTETKSSAVPFIVIAVVALAAVAFVVFKKRGKAE